MDPLDKALAFLRGDTEAIILNYARLACAIANRFPAQLREDLAGDCLLKLVEYVYLIRRHPTPDAYVKKVLRGLCYDELRKPRRQFVGFPTSSDEKESPEHDALVLNEAVSHILPEDSIFVLRRAGYNDASIAYILDMSTDKVNRVRTTYSGIFDATQR